MPDSPDRPAQDFQRTPQDLQEEKSRAQQLPPGINHQNAEPGRRCGSTHRESSIHPLAEAARDGTRDRPQPQVAMGTALQGTVKPPAPPANTACGDATSVPRSPGVADALDIDKLRRQLDCDEATLRQLALAMRADLRERMIALQTARAEQNVKHAVVHAHGLKGSLGSMAAERGAQLAKALELAALARDWALFGRTLPLLVDEARAIDARLDAVLSAPRPPGG